MSALFLGAVNSEDSLPWNITLDIFDSGVSFKIDTGADISCLPYSVYTRMRNRPPLQPNFSLLHGPSGPINCVGQFTAKTKHKGADYEFPVCVIDGQTTNCLLSRGVAEKMGLVKLIANISEEIFGDFGLMKTCPPVRIKLKQDAVPYNLTCPRRISEPLLKPVKEELDRMVSNGIIESITEPTSFCSPMVPVLKKNGKVRICVDLKKLNQSVERERFVMPTVEELASKLANAKVFSTLDCSQSFWQLPLHPEDAKLTTFISPFGRFFFKRLPYGLNSSTEIFQRVLRDLLEGIDGVFINVDDILIYALDNQTHDIILEKVLVKIKDSGLKLNKEKCKFRISQVIYQGQKFTANGMSPDPVKVTAIVNLKPPENLTQLRHIIGMANYLGRFVPNLSEVMQPMLDLLKGSNAFLWGPSQQESFDKLKEILTSSPVLVYYDMNKPTFISADASSYALGGCLLQEHDGVLKPVAYCSRSLTDSEKKWAQIEKELLALVFCCEKMQHFLVGLPKFTLLSDHKPLIPLINDKDLDRTPIRCQRLLMRLMRFNCVARHVPGKDMVVSDCLSRCLGYSDKAQIGNLSEEVDVYVCSIVHSWPATDAKLTEIAIETMKDPDLSLAMKYTINGWPEYARDIPESLQPYFAVKNVLSTTQGILTYLDRIVIPKSMKADMLERIHSSHQGIEKCRKLAATSMWWPKMNTDIEIKCKTCAFCEINKPTQPHEPLITTPTPSGPWQLIGADICEYEKQHYLIVVDYYSRYMEIIHLPNMTTKTLILKFKRLFCRLGSPHELRTDNQLCFMSAEFNAFSQEFNFKHTTSSPHFSQSNGTAERYVGIAKSILKQQDPEKALMLYLATPHTATGVSPSQLLFNRPMRTFIPSLPKPAQNSADIQAKDQNYKDTIKRNYDKRHGAKPLTPLTPGDKVTTKLDHQKQWKPAIVTATLQEPRSYLVQTENGTQYRRNRKHISISNQINEENEAPIPENISANSNEKYKTKSGRIVKPPDRYDPSQCK